MAEQMTLRSRDEFPERCVAPLRELGAYECLWARPGMTVKKIADLFRTHPDALPSELVTQTETNRMVDWILSHFAERGVNRSGVRVHRAGEYPSKLRDARHPVEVLTFRGQWNWIDSRCVAVVGSRKPSEEGRRRTRKLVELLAAKGFTIVSGLAAGIDTEAHTRALELGAPTIAVIGTPLCAVYPPENDGLQRALGDKFCVISQVPTFRYHQEHVGTRRLWFPERNATMSAVTEATIIVEASDTSGTLTQARAALYQGRKLLILDSCFRNKSLSWPGHFEQKGAVRIEDFEQVTAILNSEAASD